MRKTITLAALMVVFAIADVTVVNVNVARADNINGTVQVVTCFIGITANATPMSFGSLVQGQTSSNQSRNLTVSVSPIGAPCPISINVSFSGTNWTGSIFPNNMSSNRTNVSIDTGPLLGIPLVDTLYGPVTGAITGAVNHTMNFSVTIPAVQALDTYNQTITVTGTS